MIRIWLGGCIGSLALLYSAYLITSHQAMTVLDTCLHSITSERLRIIDQHSKRHWFSVQQEIRLRWHKKNISLTQTLYSWPFNRHLASVTSTLEIEASHKRPMVIPFTAIINQHQQLTIHLPEQRLSLPNGLEATYSENTITSLPPYQHYQQKVTFSDIVWREAIHASCAPTATLEHLSVHLDYVQTPYGYQVTSRWQGQQANYHKLHVQKFNISLTQPASATKLRLDNAQLFFSPYHHTKITGTFDPPLFQGHIRLSKELMKKIAHYTAGIIYRETPGAKIEGSHILLTLAQQAGLILSDQQDLNYHTNLVYNIATQQVTLNNNSVQEILLALK